MRTQAQSAGWRQSFSCGHLSDDHWRGRSFVYGTFVGNLLKPRLLFFGQISFDSHAPLNSMNEAFGLLFTFRAVLAVNSLLPQTHRHAFDRPGFAARVKRYGRA